VSDGPLRVAVAGLGYWGPNLARNLASLPDVELGWLIDADPERLALASSHHPQARTTASLDEALDDPSLRAVVLATSVPTHAELAIRVLDAGRDCFVEKPLARTAADAERVVETARRTGRVLMVGHLLEYHPGVARLAELADSGELGEVRYLYGNRLNLGKARA